MPSLGNIFVNPEVTPVFQGTIPGATGFVSEIHVSGLLCNSLCVARVKGALEGLPGVDKVTFLPEGDQFVIYSKSKPLPFNEIRKAISEQVIFRRARYFLSLFPRAVRHLKVRLLSTGSKLNKRLT